MAPNASYRVERYQAAMGARARLALVLTAAMAALLLLFVIASAVEPARRYRVAGETPAGATSPTPAPAPAPVPTSFVLADIAA